MATCKQLRFELRHLIKRERAAAIAVRQANAAVVAATSKLPPHYVETKDAQAARESVKPLVDTAQKASNELWDLADQVHNKRAMLDSSCKKPIKK